jgi:hydroxypyruvate reductase
MTGRGTLAATCEEIWRAALARLSAARLVGESLAADPPPGPVRVLALGKAATPMMEAARAALGARARDPLAVLPAGEPGPSGVRSLGGGHPRPDAGSRQAGEAIRAWAEAGRGESALVLLSGGGSALAVAPAEGLRFEDKVEAVAALMRAGATIHELNALRKHLSALKGGRLGLLLAAPVRVLVLSDVPGDDLSVIASGPLAPDPSRYGDAIRHLDRLGVRVPAAIRAHLEAGARGERPETPKPGDPRLSGVEHRILAGPVGLARTAAEEARARGFEAEADPAPLAGDVAQVAARAAAWARTGAGRGRRLLALGGEPTVRVPEDAPAPDGGRAQHLALLAALALEGLPAALLAAGSDGRDGPTEQAGAVVDGGTAARARSLGVDLGVELRAARSGPAAGEIGAAIPRLVTGTHLCDLVLVAVE